MVVVRLACRSHKDEGLDLMSTINSREVVDTIIAGNGIYPGDESMPVLKIVKYQNAFNGADAYGLIYKGDPLTQYDPSPFILDPEVIWEHESVKQEKPKLTMEEIIRRADEDGVGVTTDGCEVEPDGYCEHGKPSWLLKLGLI